MNKNDLRAAQRITRIDTLREAIVAAGPQGMKRADIAKLGYAASAVPDYLQELRREGRIILVPYGTQSVYCATQELADAREAELVRGRLHPGHQLRVHRPFTPQRARHGDGADTRSMGHVSQRHPACSPGACCGC